MAVRVFTSKLLRGKFGNVAANALREEFLAYKMTGVVPQKYGRDAPYRDPESANAVKLRHMHLEDVTHVAHRKWVLNTVQFDRVSDTCLVYCRGEKSNDNYLLITVLTNAHVRARKVTFMMELAELAEGFQRIY